MEHLVCRGEPVPPDEPSQMVTVRPSRTARAAMICALVGPVCSIVIVFVVSMNCLGGIFAGLAASVVALVLGLVALGQIGSSRGRLAGHGPAVAAVTLASIELLGIVWLLGFVLMIRRLDQRMECGTNLSGIGKAMLIYANDYEDRLPLAGG